MNDQFIDVLAKTLFKNVKRRRFTHEEKTRLRAVAKEMQAFLDRLHDPRDEQELRKP